MVRSLWAYRGLVASLVRRDFQVRTVRAAWGSLWLLVHPAIQILIYSVVFAGVLRAKLPGSNDRLAYGLYVCAGLITWNYFAEIVLRCQTIFLEHAHLLKTTRFPRSTLPLALFASATLNFAVVAGVLLLVLLLLGRWPGLLLVTAIPLLALQGLLGLGLGVLMGTLNVFFRDVGHAMTIVLQFWFWLTPIVYPLEVVPAPVRALLEWNPMLHLVSAYQAIVVDRHAPECSGIPGVAALCVGVGLVAWHVFRTLSPDLVDEL
jgi:lipopolysaccharide transport system permease protein